MADPSRTPPFNRTSKPGKGYQRVQLTAPATGRTRSNTCVPPKVITNGIGERVVYEVRSVKTTPVVDLD